MKEFINSLLLDMGISDKVALYLSNIMIIIGIILLSVLANLVAKKIVVKIINHSMRLNKNKWNEFILNRKVIQKLSHLLPAIIIYYFSFNFPIYQHVIENGVVVYIIIVTISVLDALLNASHDIYTTFEISKSRPIRGYIQVAKIFIFIIGGILAISRLIGESPLILLSGIGALSAIFMLIFKDSILGLVAGIQLTSNDMVRVGDWIEMSKYGADGDVIDISLNTVKVQNWDKTITTVPTYALISDSFRNWRGMQNSGGRRIKRPIYLDMTSITFCTPEMLEQFKKIHYLSDYIVQKESEIEQYNLEHNINRYSKVNGRALTNIGVFRVYIQRYLEQHPQVHKGMTCMVRQLAPDETGLPLEIYAFVNDIRWAIYEGVQSDIFDHIFAVAPEFGLRVFQNPSGHDLKSALQEEHSKVASGIDK